MDRAARPGAGRYLALGYVLAMVGAGALLFYLAGKGGDLPAIIMFSGLAWLIVSARRLPGRTRALVFRQDGSTSAPYGFAHSHRSHRYVTRHNANFVSIEARGKGPTMCDVVLFTRCGETVYVAGWLDRDAAHRVAVDSPWRWPSCARAPLVSAAKAALRPPRLRKLPESR